MTPDGHDRGKLVMRVLRSLAIGVAGVAAAIALFLVGVIVVDRLSQPPRPDPAALIAKGERHHARIRRDDFGVPHISGSTDADVAYGLAYAHAEDDFVTIQDATLTTRGTLATEKGSDGAVSDYIVNLLRVWPTVNARYDRDLPVDLKRVLEAYADGINAYGARHPSAVTQGLLPVTGKDIAAGFVFKTPLWP